MAEPGSICVIERCEQRLKQSGGNWSIGERMESDESFEQPANAFLSIRERFEPCSNVIDERLEHPLKQS
jgi:hypothetical protein